MDYKLLKLNEMIKKILFLLLFSGSSLTFFSCIDLDVDKQTVADTFISTKIIDGDTLFAISGYVSSNTTMKSVTMKNPDGSLPVDLKQIEYYGYYFEKALNDKEYTSQKPAAGKYQFEIEYEDKTTCDTTNYVSADILAPIEIKEIKPNSTNKSIIINWVKNSVADYYVVRIFKNDSIIYITNEIDPGYTSMIVYNYSNGWVNNYYPEAGDSLEVVISGVLYESGSSQNTQFQSVSNSSEAGVVWPE
jgi:hypothetical protein